MILRRILAALAVLYLLWPVAPVHAQKSKATLNAEISAQFPDNTLGQITPLNLRNVTGDIVNSIMPAAPVVSGNFASFSGTTGLLQDSGQGAGGISLTPTSGTTNPGLTVTQTGPASGTPTGPVLFNSITLIDQGIAPNGSGLDSFGQIQDQVNALRVNMQVQGGFATKGALSVAVNITGSTAGVYGIVGGTYQNVNAGGNNWGLIGYANLGPSGTQTGNLIAAECEILAATGSTLTNRACLSINSQGPVAGSGIDAAIVVSLLQGSVTGYTAAPAPFTNFVYFSNNFYSANAQPIASVGGNIFKSDAMSIANFLNFSNVTITGKIFSTPNLSVPGNTAGFTLPAVSNAGAFQFGGQGSGGINIEIDAFTGPARFVGRRADTSSTAPSAVQSGETISALTAQGFGTTYNELSSIGTVAAQNFTVANGGTYISIQTTPLNSITEGEVVRIQQGLMVGTTTDPGAGIVNVATGYRIANAATSGNVLRGNGTNFISAQLAATDLTGILPVANGGTNCSSASGTCLDNITGFASAGIIVRTGAGTYTATNPTGAVKDNGSGTLTQAASTDLSDTTAATTWVPTDASGASLSFTNGGSNWSKSNKTCVGNFHITFPSTANGATAQINLPCTNANNGAQAIGSCQTSAAGSNGFLSFSAAANSSVGAFAQTTGLVQPTNANLSTAVVECFFAFNTT